MTAAHCTLSHQTYSIDQEEENKNYDEKEKKIMIKENNMGLTVLSQADRPSTSSAARSKMPTGCSWIACILILLEKIKLNKKIKSLT